MKAASPLNLHMCSVFCAKQYPTYCLLYFTALNQTAKSPLICNKLGYASGCCSRWLDPVFGPEGTWVQSLKNGCDDHKRMSILQGSIQAMNSRVCATIKVEANNGDIISCQWKMCTDVGYVPKQPAWQDSRRKYRIQYWEKYRLVALALASEDNTQELQSGIVQHQIYETETSECRTAHSGGPNWAGRLSLASTHCIS